MKISIIEVRPKDNGDNYSTMDLPFLVMDWTDVTEEEYQLLWRYLTRINGQYRIVVDQSVHISALIGKAQEWQEKERAREVKRLRRVQGKKPKNVQRSNG